MNSLVRVAVAVTLAITALSAPAHAAATVPQAGPNPVVLAPGLTVLPATAAERDASVSVYQDGDVAKNWFTQGFTARGAYLGWTVSAPAAGSYRVFALVNAAAGQRLALEGASDLTFTATGGWNKIDAGTLNLPAGTSTIKLRRAGTISGDVQVKSLEVIRDSEYPAFEQRVAAARAAADTSWLRAGDYGLMFQYGSWGYPGSVGPAKSLEQQAADFDVKRFVNTVAETGASYVIWSFSWWGYRPDMPSDALDAIMGDGAATAERDLIGEVAAALHAKGIRFALYYHEGKEESAWWQRQRFPATFPPTGTGDRGTFLTNWKNVVSEIGRRLGGNLDGFFFDDGMVYYPAPFEELQAAARTGNPARTISWNSASLPRLTEFQDVYFGEGHTGQPLDPAGPYGGLRDHGMFTLENDWGVHLRNQPIVNNGITSEQAISWVSSAKGPLSFNLMMYEDGTVSERSLAILNDVRQAVRGTAPTVPGGTSTVNDTDPAIAYGGGWQHAAGRGAGDYGDDVHYATADGASASYTFTGTGVDVLGPRSDASGRFDVYLDGARIGRFSQHAGSGYTPQAVLYGARHLAPGSHTIKLVKVDGTYLQLDALRTVPDPEVRNDTALAYQGEWSHHAGRGAGDYQDDVTSTARDGDSVTIAFTGSGLRLRGPMEPVDGTASVTLDGKPAGTVIATYGGAYTPQQVYWATDHLPPGPHTVTVTKTGGNWLQLDSATIIP